MGSGSGDAFGGSTRQSRGAAQGRAIRVVARGNGFMPSFASCSGASVASAVGERAISYYASPRSREAAASRETRKAVANVENRTASASRY
jgi:hypothetical protein